MQDLVIASANSGKLIELTALLSKYRCRSQAEFGLDSPAETGQTFVENALIKARFASEATKLPALADDSGLVIPALNGAPGIYSARFAGDNASDSNNNALVLEKMQATSHRNAYFYCVIVLLHRTNDPMPIITSGKLSGKITYKPMGSHGFGYDSIFYLPNYACTLAQLSATIKNTISHRALALKQLKHHLNE